MYYSLSTLRPMTPSVALPLLGKRQKTRAIPLHPTVWCALQSFRPGDASSDDYVFQSRQTSIRDGKPSRRLRESQVWRVVSTIAEQAGVRNTDKPVSPHWMRHAHATHAMEKNTPLKVIQETLGHADLRTPAHYQHVMPEVSSSLALDL
jgi:integrase/recombinase XerD